MNWSLAKAKDNLSEVVRRAREQGPQEISVHGKAAAVMLSVDDYRRLKDPSSPKTLKEWLLAIPPGSFDGVEFERDPRPAREIDPF